MGSGLLGGICDLLGQLLPLFFSSFFFFILLNYESMGIKSAVRRTERQNFAFRDPTLRVYFVFLRFILLLFGEFRPPDLKSRALIISSKSSRFGSKSVRYIFLFVFVSS
jgi:hypothetical protein